MFTLIFLDRKTDRVTYAIPEVRIVRYITPSEIGFVDKISRIRLVSFMPTEDLKIERD